MRIKYRFIKSTKNYRRYDPQDVPAGFIFASIYMPLTDTAVEFTVSTENPV